MTDHITFPIWIATGHGRMSTIAELGIDRTRRTRCARPLFITALENGDQLEDAQKAAGHRDASTTTCMIGADNPEKTASLFVTS